MKETVTIDKETAVNVTCWDWEQLKENPDSINWIPALRAVAKLTKNCEQANVWCELRHINFVIYFLKTMYYNIIIKRLKRLKVNRFGTVIKPIVTNRKETDDEVRKVSWFKSE